MKVVKLKKFELFVYVPKSSMYKFKVHIYLICVPFCAGQKSCGIKNQMKLGRSQTDFKITIGRTVFRKSCLKYVKVVNLKNFELFVLKGFLLLLWSPI